MLREMSQLRIFRRNCQKNAPQEESENASENPTDSSSTSLAMIGSTRMPLCPISEVVQNPQGATTENSSGSRRFDGTPTKTKGKAVGRTDNSETPAFTTPEKHGSVPGSTGNAHNRNRFGWPQKHDASSREASIPSGRRSPLLRENHNESTGDLSFTPRSLNYTNGSETQHANGSMPQSNRGLVVGNGGSNYGTPRSVRTGGKASSNHSESGSNSSTPTKSVSRPLNNGHSGAPFGGAGMNNFRPPGSQNSVARTGNFFQSSKTLAVATPPPTVVNTVEVPHFELNEDPSFWMDHNVQVLIRIRPLNSAEIASQGYSRCLKQENSQIVTWLGPPETRFTFDHVACETTTQEMLFKVAGLPMVENCMSGYNSCMFAYGQTGSGKTHTMLGDIDELDQRPSANRGMTPRIFEYLFARIKAEEESHRHERLKYLREDIKKGVYVDNLSEVEVRNVHDIVQLLLQGAASRRVAATNMNRESSRSHSVFTCVIESQWEKDSMTNIRYGRLNLVDLAGSERQKSSGAEGERLKEAANINKSLSTLGLVIMILVDVAHGKQRHIPYRDSRLTFLLQDSLGGNSKTTIIANISPSICSANETLSTLKFAQRAKFIQNNAIVNEDASGDVMALQLQIQQLKEELNFFKRQNVSRSLSFRSTIFSEIMPGANGEGSMTVVPSNNLEAAECPPELLQGTRALGSPRVSNKKMKSLEATLVGALRREQVAENATKRLEAEIEQLNRLVRQREEDTQCSKMMLRFREDKIRRLESVADGLLSADVYLLEEKNALFEELQLIRGRLDRNPELTRFAMENIRLLEQLRRFQDFYEGGEREILLAEVSDLRDQLVEILEGKLDLDKNPCTMSTHRESFAPELAAAARENQLLRLEVDNTHKEIEDCRSNLSACLEANAKMTREIDELHIQLNELKATHFQQQKELETLRPKEIKSNGDKTVESEHALQIITDLKAQLRAEMELRTQLENAQASMKNNRHDLQEKAQREQELEMRHSEEIMQLQLELESVETVLEEERVSRKDAEDRALQFSHELEAASGRCLQLTTDLEAALAKVDDGKSVIEALESQQLFSINELENLQEKNKEFLDRLSNKEEEIIKLKRQNETFQEELKRDQELRALEQQRQDQCGDSSMQTKLERMQKALERARKLNMRFQLDQASQTSHEEEMDQVRRQVETETAEAIICLQEELVALRQHVDLTSARESDTNKNLVLLKREIEELQVRLNCANEENGRLLNVTIEKDAEIKALKDEWEKAATEIANYLADGDQALDDASEQMDNIMDSFPQRRLRVDQGVERVVTMLAEKEKIIEVLQKRLQHAHKLARDTEEKIRSLKEATLAITEVQLQENEEMTKETFKLRLELSEKLSILQGLENKLELCEGSLKEAEKRANAAFIMVKKLTEVNEFHLEAQKKAGIQLEGALELITLKENLIQDMQNGIFEAKMQIDSLKQQVLKSEEEGDKLKLALAFQQEKLEASEVKAKFNEEAFLNMEEQFEKSWQQVFEVETNLCLSFGAIERELHAERQYSITFSETFNRRVQEQVEAVHALRENLLYKVVHQTEEIEKAKETRDKENTLVIAFVESIIAAKEMQHHNDRIMCQLKKCESSLKCTRDKLKLADLELNAKDVKVQEMTIALQALEVTKANIESEKQQLLLMANRAISTCSDKEQELQIAQQELASIQLRLGEVEGKACSLGASMDNTLKQLKDLEDERSRLMVIMEAQKSKWNDERQVLCSEKEELGEQMANQKLMLTEELVSTQSKLQSTEQKLAELVSTVEVLMLERSNWGVEKEAMQKDEVDARCMISDKEKELLSLHSTLAEVELKLKSADDKVDALSAIVNDLMSSEENWRSERAGLSSRVEHLQALLIEREKEVEVFRNQVTQISEAIPKERDRLHAEVLVLNEQLEMAQAFADEREAIAVEAHQVAEARKTYAEEKEEEARLLERSVEELERTVNALENQVDIVKREAERQRLMREDLELELQALRHQMSTVQGAHRTMAIQCSSDSMESQNENQRLVSDNKLELCETRKQIKSLEKEKEDKDAEIKKCKAHITELILNAETQANEYQEKYKALEAMAHQLKAEQTNMTSTTNKIGEKTAAKSRGSGSPFKCIGLGLAQQMNSEMDEELYAARHRVEELEALLATRQKESVLDHQQVQKIAEKARRQSEESQEKEQEVVKLKHQLNELIEERESWLDEINRRQAEMVAARVAAEKLRQRDQFLTTENEMLKTDNANQKKRLVEIEDEEENNALRAQNEELSARLRRTEVLLARVNDELARYRTADGRTPYISIDEEQRLRNKLQETEEERVQIAQKLLSLCTSILQAAGIVRPPRDIDPSLAVESLHQLKDRLECAERELRDLKLKTKIAGEKVRLSELRQQSNSPLSVKTNENSFTAAQKCPSPVLSSLRVALDRLSFKSHLP
eukprot:Gb_22755 [translate_table: standard]